MRKMTPRVVPRSLPDTPPVKEERRQLAPVSLFLPELQLQGPMPRWAFTYIFPVAGQITHQALKLTEIIGTGSEGEVISEAPELNAILKLNGLEAFMGVVLEGDNKRQEPPLRVKAGDKVELFLRAIPAGEGPGAAHGAIINGLNLSFLYRLG